MVSHYMGQGMTRDKALAICRLSKHQFYYRSTGKERPGRPATHQTLYNGSLVEDAYVVDWIKEVQSDPDTDYGYRKMYYQLLQSGFSINHKKVYRLMKSSNLLKERIRHGTGKSYAHYRIVTPERPLQVLEMDIKMVWVVEHRRHAYILNIIDTFTRKLLYWSVGYQMKQAQVKQAWMQIITEYLQPADLLNKELHVELRNDNGPQFSATSVREFLAENHIKQTFTHPYTPQENAHVESFHGILNKALTKQSFWSLDELENRLEGFYDTYNNRRLHASIAYLSPVQFCKCWQEGLIERKVMAKKKVKFKIKVPYQELSGFESLREVFCADFKAPNGLQNQNLIQLTNQRKVA